MAVQHQDIAEAYLHQPKGASTASLGTCPISNGAGGTSWGIASPTVAISLDITSLDTATAYNVISPYTGTITKIVSVIDSALATADTTITASIGGVNITSGVLTIATAGSGSGIIDTATPSALNTISIDNAIKFTVAGGSTGAVRCHLMIYITRTA